MNQVWHLSSLQMSGLSRDREASSLLPQEQEEERVEDIGRHISAQCKEDFCNN